MALAAAGAPNEPKPGWRILFTAEAARWYRGLSREDRTRMAAAFDRLQERGPSVRRPFVGAIRGSRHHNMKELRSSGGNLRALFAFDNRRQAVVLVGGDKTRKWQSFYNQAIPKADRLYDQHLRRMGREGPWAQRHRSRGRSSDGKSR